MKQSISFFSLSSSLLLLLLFHGVNCADIVTDTCTKATALDPTLNLGFCVASLQADPNSQNSDLEGLGLISINLVVANGTSIDSHIQQLLKDQGGDPKAKKYLQDCDELYSDAISTANDAISSFKSKDYNGANIKLSSAIDAASTCEDGFNDAGLVSPLTKENDVFTQLTKIGLAITVILQ